ncbi:MAG TPA: ATP-binding protein, partial [Planctomycetota bacterium]|nr:ATP-binding protein [Planctomycetota bacterium]
DHTERRRAAEELAVRARQQEVVARLGCRALATADLDGAFASAVALVAETLDVELCRLVEASPDGERMAVRAGVGWREGCVGACLAPENRAFIRATLESGGPITFEDLAKEARFGPIPLLVEHGVVSGASAIVFGAEHRFGVLSAFSRRPRKFSADDLNFLQAIANVLGAAIERARSEVALRESEGRFRAVFENTLDAVLVADDDGVYVEANPAACALLGMPREELVGRRVAEIVDGDGGEARWQAFLAEGAARGVVAIRRADGKRRLVDFVARANVLPGRHISALRDVTEHETLERQLRQAQKMEAVGRLAGGVAHDFNNLLTAITGYSDLAVAALRPEDPLRRDLEEIRKAALRAAQLTRQLLAFSRKQVIEPRLMDLNSVLANLEPMLRRLIGEDIALEAKPGRCLSVVQADPGQVEQVIMNLVVNARDAMPDGGRLALETADVRLDEAHPLRPADLRPGAYVMLSVVDTGCGMDSATLSHIFEPFFTTKEQGKGTGLGLSTVYGIVKQAGGAVSVQSQPGQGSAFRIFFPAAQGEADPLEPRGATPVPARGTETVLLVEDEDLLRALAARTLQQHGYRVVEARHGGEALAIAEKHEGAIELLVTDVIMPQINGRELADRLRPSRPEMKVLFTSGYTPDEVLRRGVREGAANFIQKPFAPAAFARKVREVLDG